MWFTTDVLMQELKESMWTTRDEIDNELEQDKSKCLNISNFFKGSTQSNGPSLF